MHLGVSSYLWLFDFPSFSASFRIVYTYVYIRKRRNEESMESGEGGVKVVRLSRKEKERKILEMWRSGHTRKSVKRCGYHPRQ